MPATLIHPSDPAYRRVSVALFVAGLATFALLYTLQPVLPLLAEQFEITPGMATLSVSAATITLGLSLLIAARISDRHGRTKIIVGSLFCSALLGLALALAPNWPALLGLRLAEGVALAGVPAVAMAYLREEITPDAHAQATGLYVGGTAIGGMTGRILAGLLADVGGWRLAAAGIGVLGLICAVTVALLLPPSRNFAPRERSRAATGLLAAGSMLPLYAIGGLMMGSFVAIYNAITFRLTSAPYLLSAGVAGLVFLVYSIGSVGSALAGRMTNRFSRAEVVLAASVLTIIGVLLTIPSALVVVVVGLAVMTFGFFGAHGVASGWVTARAQRIGAPVGQAASLYLFSYYLGSSVFGTWAGGLWHSRGWGGVVLLALALVMLSIVATFYAGGHSPAPAQRTELTAT